MSALKKRITFTGSLLVVDDQNVDVNALIEAFSTEAPTVEATRFEKYKATLTKGVYLAIVLEDGNTLPRPDTVTNIITLEEEPNPRSDVQLETNKTLILIDGGTSNIWISNYLKLPKIVSRFQVSFPKQRVYTKDIYDKDKFKEAIKKIDSIKFSLAPDAFSGGTVLSKALSDEINGFDAVEAEVYLKFDEKKIDKLLRSRLDELFDKKESYKRIMIQGRDEKNLGLLFNSKSFARKFDVDADLNENGMFDESSVLEKLINGLENEKTTMVS